MRQAKIQFKITKKRKNRMFSKISATALVMATLSQAVDLQRKRRTYTPIEPPQELIGKMSTPTTEPTVEPRSNGLTLPVGGSTTIIVE